MVFQMMYARLRYRELCIPARLLLRPRCRHPAAPAAPRRTPRGATAPCPRAGTPSSSTARASGAVAAPLEMYRGQNSRDVAGRVWDVVSTVRDAACEMPSVTRVVRGGPPSNAPPRQVRSAARLAAFVTWRALLVAWRVGSWSRLRVSVIDLFTKVVQSSQGHVSRVWSYYVRHPQTGIIHRSRSVYYHDIKGASRRLAVTSATALPAAPSTLGGW